MTPELVIFDCDGVLVDTEPATDVVLAEYLNGCGLTISPDEVHSLFAGGTMASVGSEATKRGATLPANWQEEIYAAVFARLCQGVQVFEGVVDLITQLQAQGIAIASNGPIRKMEITLKPNGLWDRFAPHIYSGHDHGPKPAPDMLLRIMADFGVPAERTVMIDDTISGWRAAQAAGVRCFAYLPHPAKTQIAAADAIAVDSMAAIGRALNLP